LPQSVSALSITPLAHIFGIRIFLPEMPCWWINFQNLLICGHFILTKYVISLFASATSNGNRRMAAVLQGASKSYVAFLLLCTIV